MVGVFRAGGAVSLGFSLRGGIACGSLTGVGVGVTGVVCRAAFFFALSSIHVSKPSTQADTNPEPIGHCSANPSAYKPIPYQAHLSQPKPTHKLA